MAKGYRPVRRDQLFLLPPDMREWLPPGHPVWLLAEVVAGHLDTSAFHARRRTGGAGTAGYDPDMLLTLLIWAYAQGLTSSRRIEAACWTDVAFRVICAGDVPDHTTIARFRADFAGPVEDLFTQVLMLCARLGMGGLGTITLDGTKIAANASKAANRTEEGLRKLAAQAVAAHGRADAAVDGLPGAGEDARQVPPQLARPGGRAARIAVALAELEAERAAAQRDAEAKTSAYVMRTASGRGGGPPAGTEVAAARAALARETARQQARIEAREQRRAQSRAATGKDLTGPPLTAPGQYHLVRAAAARLAAAQAKAAQREARAAAAAARRKGPPGPVRNITDRDSRLMPVRGGGFIQGFNAQNVISEDKLIIATELTQDPGDTRWFEPMLRRAETAAQVIASCQAPSPDPAAAGPAASLIGLMLADAGYLSEHNLTIKGPDRLIATGKQRDLEKTARTSNGSSSPAHGEAVAAMAARLATDEGITAYRQRGHIAETPHAQIKHNLGIRRLCLRGKPKAAAEWAFTCTVHNLAKAISTSHLTTAALSALAGQPS